MLKFMCDRGVIDDDSLRFKQYMSHRQKTNIMKNFNIEIKKIPIFGRLVPY